MKERIDINVPEDVLALNQKKKERLEKTYRFEATDRVPVWPDFQIWSLLAGRKGKYSDLTKGPREHLHGQILNQKWRIENVRDDFPIETECLTIEPQFGAIRGVEFPIEIEWMGDESPKSKHLLQEPEEIDTLEIPSPDCGLNHTRIEWYKTMSEMTGDFDVRLNGEPLQVKLDLTHPGGAIPSAFALCGSNLFVWMLEEPDRIHRLLEITTQSHLQVIEYFAELTGREKGHSVWAGADIAEMISPQMFQEFVVPYYLQIWKKQNYPRVFHMCGKIDHLLDILRDDLDITYLDRFGFSTNRQLLAKKLAGQAVMRGGPHPALIYEGPVEKITKECVDYIKTLGSQGGYILSDGVGIVPGTPMAHIEAMVDASKQVGPLI
ncbi:MAG: hypothetical protein HQM13_08065 [SAR324 cluster bacterium]|nr:hypothetical protein [SAR324 cluster bacterium]